MHRPMKLRLEVEDKDLPSLDSSLQYELLISLNLVGICSGFPPLSASSKALLSSG